MSLRGQLNEYGKRREPILFIIDFDIQNFFIYPLDNIPSNILYKFENFSNLGQNTKPLDIYLKKEPMDFFQYEKYFKEVKQQIRHGNTYLLNLSFPTPVSIYPKEKNIGLRDICINADSKFKLLIDNKFVSFSPERFIKIKENKISTYPIKGTIDASIANAKSKILSDIKESAEHTMIVDLLRNDLGIIGSDIKVNYFRDVEKINAGKADIENINTEKKELLQVSSEIEAKLENNWQNRLGENILSLLPAGSVSGTPKRQSVEIINNIEGQYNNYKREFFCGICGYFDGNSLDSFVLIRFLQEDKGKFIYKSGGGITSDSDVLKEYNEMLDKVYIPIKNVF